MRRGLVYASGAIVLAMVSFTIGAAQFRQQAVQQPPAQLQVQSAPGPYYSLPAWSQKLPSVSRFLILSDWDGAAVLDKETGLVWQRAPQSATSDFPGANKRCAELVLGNRMGWRLPTVQELASLVDGTAASVMKLPSGHPFVNVKNVNYWSTSYVWEPGQVRNHLYSVDFHHGTISTISILMPDGTPVGSYYWCVRGGQN